MAPVRVLPLEFSCSSPGFTSGILWLQPGFNLRNSMAPVRVSPLEFSCSSPGFTSEILLFPSGFYLSNPWLQSMFFPPCLALVVPTLQSWFTSLCRFPRLQSVFSPLFTLCISLAPFRVFLAAVRVLPQVFPGSGIFPQPVFYLRISQAPVRLFPSGISWLQSVFSPPLAAAHGLPRVSRLRGSAPQIPALMASSSQCGVPWRWLGLCGLAVSLGLEALARYIRARGRGGPLCEVLFFPAPLTCPEPALSPGRSCLCPLSHEESTLSRLLRRLLEARSSLELCVFTVSSAPLAQAVLQLHQRGLRVRIITDSDYMAIPGNQIGALRKAESQTELNVNNLSFGADWRRRAAALLGIVVRHNHGPGYMHHKFAILDRTIVMTGSLNWTMQALHTNKENLLISSEGAFTTAYLEEFERLWEEYDPATYDFFPEQGQK
uniref:Mitochondrial cardiolipin hydrolase n=1 Tax=Leptobrachium leishanense TaxID=445787 RepID=A0A8C5WF16_9ANUR